MLGRCLDAIHVFRLPAEGPEVQMIREKGRIRGVPGKEMPRDMWKGIPLDRSEDVLSATTQNETGWKMPKVWVVNWRKDMDADDGVVRLA